jgi:SAM-dependent methyltransferase
MTKVNASPIVSNERLHKRRQRARNLGRKKEAIEVLLQRLPPIRQMPSVGCSLSTNIHENNNNLSSLFCPIPPLQSSREFWDQVPSICNPLTATLCSKIAGKKELGSDRYHNDKYHRKLHYQNQDGIISKQQLEELWRKHSRSDGVARTTTTTAPTIVNDEAETQNQKPSKNPRNKEEAVSLLSNERGKRKAWQIENFVSLLRGWLARQNKQQKPVTVVDFGCGSGNLCLALAPYFKNVQFVLVDKKPYPLTVAKRRAVEAGLINVQVIQYNFSPSNLEDFSVPCYKNSQSSYNDAEEEAASRLRKSSTTRFDLGIGLHCCGSFTDMVMSLSLARGADCIVCPCCNGAMTSKTTHGYEYPRSTFVRSLMAQEEYLGQLSRAADDLRHYEAKCLIEYDRALWARDNGFNVELFKLTPEECTPKHHLLYLTNQKSRGMDNSMHDTPLKS